MMELTSRAATLLRKASLFVHRGKQNDVKKRWAEKHVTEAVREVGTLVDVGAELHIAPPKQYQRHS